MIENVQHDIASGILVISLVRIDASKPYIIINSSSSVHYMSNIVVQDKNNLKPSRIRFVPLRLNYYVIILYQYLLI